MVYNEFHGKQLSALGLGCMRLPYGSKGDADIDVAQVREMIACAMKQGINYYDTAWGYHNGNSETVIGEELSKYPRDSYYLATKFPGYDLLNMPKVKSIFEEQLRKCKVDYFDFYLFHNVCEMNIDAYLNPRFGIYDYLMEQKKNGRIRHLGFSCHGQYEVLKRFLEAYGSDMEFCQLQLNYLDWTFQDDERKVGLLNEYHIPVWVMEPLRGGKLASLEPAQEEKLKALRPEETVPAWAFRFLQSLPEVTMILSGMSNMEQLTENIQTFETVKPLNKVEMDTLAEIVEAMLMKKTLPCTSCRYCTEYCPQKLDIPYLISLYNEHTLSDGGFFAPMALSKVDKDKWPNACLHCRQCEKVCPQQIKISEAMEDFSSKLS